MVRLHMLSGATMRYSNFRKDERAGEAFFIEVLNMNDMDYETAKSLFLYDSNTGILTWASYRKNSFGIIGRVAGSKDDEGYIRIQIKGKRYSAHRIAWTLYHEEPPRMYLDHINGIKDDNRICNLRDVTHSYNISNRGLTKNNTSGRIGVRWHKASGKWQVRITKNKSRHDIGTFKQFSDAVYAIESAELEILGYIRNRGCAEAIRASGKENSNE